MNGAMDFREPKFHTSSPSLESFGRMVSLGSVEIVAEQRRWLTCYEGPFDPYAGVIRTRECHLQLVLRERAFARDVTAR